MNNLIQQKQELERQLKNKDAYSSWERSIGELRQLNKDISFYTKHLEEEIEFLKITKNRIPNSNCKVKSYIKERIAQLEKELKG